MSEPHFHGFQNPRFHGTVDVESNKNKTCIKRLHQA